MGWSNTDRWYTGSCINRFPYSRRNHFPYKQRSGCRSHLQIRLMKPVQQYLLVPAHELFQNCTQPGMLAFFNPLLFWGCTTFSTDCAAEKRETNPAFCLLALQVNEHTQLWGESQMCCSLLVARFVWSGWEINTDAWFPHTNRIDVFL